MKDYLRQILRGIDNPVLARCLTREYLQARLLQSLQDRGAFHTWVFQGGTALRFLYSMPRFSEDLDFALVEPGMPAAFRENVTGAQRAFAAESYEVSIRINDKRTVKSAFVSFKGLLFELGLSAHASETLSIKVEMLDWKQVAADVEPFLERPADLGLLKRENLLSLLRREG
jgi:hypothetical protein